MPLQVPVLKNFHLMDRSWTSFGILEVATALELTGEGEFVFSMFSLGNEVGSLPCGLQRYGRGSMK